MPAWNIGRRQLSGTRKSLYGAWRQMRTRCNNPHTADYLNYGGRGIIVCGRWDSFLLFEKDIGPHPGKGWTLDRINNNLGYSKTNCRWATRVTQNRNRRSTRLTPEKAQEIRKLECSLAVTAKLYGVHKSTIARVRQNNTWV